MRVLDDETRRAVQNVINAEEDKLRAIPGFVAAEPGFPVIDGVVHKEPAIVVFVTHKRPPGSVPEEDRVPRQVGPYRVSVMQADPMRQISSMSAHEDLAAALTEARAPAALTYTPIEGNPIDAEFVVSTPMLCHVGPDAGWPVLKPFIEGTRKTLTVAMYDFNADYIAKTFIDSVRASDIKVTLTWDDGMTAPETQIRNSIREKLGANLDGWIVQCGAGRRFASAYHEKVAVRDATAFWLSSGNWSLRSQPDIDPLGEPPSAKGMYGKGNREWHIIVEDETLARLFQQYIEHDRDGSKEEAAAGDGGAVLDVAELPRFPDLFVPLAELAVDFAAPPAPVAPAALPTTRRDVKVVPVLTPDNYLKRINELLRRATRKLYLQYAYINYSADDSDREFAEMLGTLADLSYQPRMDLRIIVGSGGATDKIRKLVEAGFNEKVFRAQRNVHNKGIVVDGEWVLVSSANWSSDGVLRNRDAGLIIHDDEIAAYYEGVFLADWNDRASARLADDQPAIVATEAAEMPAGMARVSWRDYYG